MIDLPKSLLIALTVLTVAGCGSPSGQLVGAWTMQGKPKTWEFRKDGTFEMESPLGRLDVKQGGTYALSGSKLTLNLSGKNVATSNDPKDKMTVDVINGSSIPPRTQDWDIAWKSATEFELSTSETGKSVTKTFDRKS